MLGVEEGSVHHLVSSLEMVAVKATLGRWRDGGGGSQLPRKTGKMREEPREFASPAERGPGELRDSKQQPGAS